MVSMNIMSLSLTTYAVDLHVSATLLIFTSLRRSKLAKLYLQQSGNNTSCLLHYTKSQAKKYFLINGYLNII